jgi:hypothetical protein
MVQFTWYRSTLEAAAPVARREVPRLPSWIASTSRSICVGVSRPGRDRSVASAPTSMTPMPSWVSRD